MHNKRMYKKLMTLLDWFILILPLIVFVGYIIVNQHLTEELTFNDIVTGFNGLFSWLNETPLFLLFNNLGKNILGVNNNLYTNPILTSVMLYCVYIVIVVLFDMIRDLLLLIPTWFNDMIGK